MEKVEVRKIVSSDPEVMNGVLVFAGTRVPVDVLIEHVIGGEGLDDFLEGFPTVTRGQAVAFLEMTPDVVGRVLAGEPAGR